MQKKIIALAVAGLVSGAAFAQSNVTVYGVADLTFDRVQATGATVSGSSLKARNRVSSNSSLLGFKGSEALGNGMNAVFQLESTVGIDSATGITLNRDSYVGLNGGFGTVVMGNLTGPTRGLGAAMDPFAGATGIGANSALLGKLGGERFTSAAAVPSAAAATCTASTTCASIFDTRWTNAIAYISPSFGGVNVTAAYVANENKSADGFDGTASQRNTWGYDVGVKYAAGPIMAALTQNQVKVGDTASTKATDTRLGGTYNFGMGTVGLMFDRVKAEATGTSVKRNAWFVPVTFNVGSGKIIAQYGQAADIKGCAAGCDDTAGKLMAVGYEHSLSKRTMLKAIYSQVKNEASASYDFGVNASGAASGADPKGFQVGVRHSF
jgi:predicted porin